MPKICDEHRAAVRERLLDAAQEAVVELGVDKASTREMLARAGLSFGSLYHYFPGGKDEIVLALAERIFSSDLRSLLPENPGPDSDARSVLLHVLGRMFRPDASSLLPQLRPRAVHDEALRAALGRWDSLIVNSMAPLVAEAQTDGSIRADINPESLIETVIVFFEGLRTRQASHAFATDGQAVIDTFLDIVLVGVTPQTRLS